MVNSMKKRVISAIIALIIVVPLILIGGYAYYIGVGIIAIIGFNELISVREKEKKIPMIMKVLTLVSYLAIVMSAVKKITSQTNYIKYFCMFNTINSNGKKKI